MATAASVSGKKSTPDMPVFSYAQAAKGLASDSKQTTAAPSVDDTATATAAAAAATASAATSMAVDGQADDAGKAVSASPSLGPSTSTTSTLVKEDDLSTTTPNGTTTATASESGWEKQSQASTAADSKEKAASSSSALDDEKLKSEASWENNTANTPPQKEQKEQKEQRELKAAPPPAVNIWQQRQEALEAKAKANALLKPATTTTSSSNTTAPGTKTSSTQTSGDVRSEHYKGGSRKKTDAASTDATRDKKKSTDGMSLPFPSLPSFILTTSRIKEKHSAYQISRR